MVRQQKYRAAGQTASCPKADNDTDDDPHHSAAQLEKMLDKRLDGLFVLRFGHRLTHFLLTDAQFGLGVEFRAHIAFAAHRLLTQRSRMQRRNIGSRSFDIADFNRRCGGNRCGQILTPSAVLLGLGIFSSDRLLSLRCSTLFRNLGRTFIFSAA